MVVGDFARLKCQREARHHERVADGNLRGGDGFVADEFGVGRDADDHCRIAVGRRNGDGLVGAVNGGNGADNVFGRAAQPAAQGRVLMAGRARCRSRRAGRRLALLMRQVGHSSVFSLKEVDWLA